MFPKSYKNILCFSAPQNPPLLHIQKYDVVGR